jgi:hypothetical protein
MARRSRLVGGIEQLCDLSNRMSVLHERYKHRRDEHAPLRRAALDAGFVANFGTNALNAQAFSARNFKSGQG